MSSALQIIFFQCHRSLTVVKNYCNESTYEVVVHILPPGGSSGAAMYCALLAAKKYNMTAGDRVVVVLPDTIRNYM
jgi:cysteine synthase